MKLNEKLLKTDEKNENIRMSQKLISTKLNVKNLEQIIKVQIGPGGLRMPPMVAVASIAGHC